MFAHNTLSYNKVEIDQSLARVVRLLKEAEKRRYGQRQRRLTAGYFIWQQSEPLNDAGPPQARTGSHK
jgi:hypothetical protein